MARIHRFRSPLVALIAIVFSASIAMAGQPVGKGLTNASQHAGRTVPVQAADPSEGTDESPEASESPESNDSRDTTDPASDHCNVDLTQDPSVLAGLNHGSVVCTAAHMATPDGYANHGAWVSHWAKMGKGADASTTGKAQKAH